MLKQPGSRWRPNDRSGAWLKLKPDYIHVRCQRSAVSGLCLLVPLQWPVLPGPPCHGASHTKRLSVVSRVCDITKGVVVSCLPPLSTQPHRM